MSLIDDVFEYRQQNTTSPRAVLITGQKTVPLLWKTLSNNFATVKPKIAFGAHRDTDASSAGKLGFKGAKIVVYPAGSSTGIAYEGDTKFEPLTVFLQDLVSGNLSTQNSEADISQPPADSKTEPEYVEPKPSGRPGDEL